MKVRVSFSCMLGFVAMFALSMFLSAVDGGYWRWYSFMAAFAIVPLFVGPLGYRIVAICALILSVFLIVGDYRAGRIWDAHRRELIQKAMHNQSPDPTPASITSAAGQPTRQP